MPNTQPETPVSVVELIKDIIQDKVVCDVGCGTGTFLEAMKPYAKRVFGIEEKPEICELARSKGLEVFCRNSFMTPLPIADVYYLYTLDLVGVFLKAQLEKRKGTYILGDKTSKELLNTLNYEERGNEFKVYITKVG